MPMYYTPSKTIFCSLNHNNYSNTTFPFYMHTEFYNQLLCLVSLFRLVARFCNVLYLTTPQVSKEKEVADEEERKVAKINEEVSKKQRDCEHDLAKAEPALKAAAEALNTLNKVYQMLLT